MKKRFNGKNRMENREPTRRNAPAKVAALTFAQAEAVDDRQIDEIERTFTLRYEW